MPRISFEVVKSKRTERGWEALFGIVPGSRSVFATAEVDRQ